MAEMVERAGDWREAFREFLRSEQIHPNAPEYPVARTAFYAGWTCAASSPPKAEGVEDRGEQGTAKP